MTTYNELYTDSGSLREAYACLESRIGRSVLSPTPSELDLLSRSAQFGDRKTFPVPLVLGNAEFEDVLAPGVHQRALALQELFADIAIGGQKLVSRNQVSAAELEHTLYTESTDVKSLRTLWAGQSPEQIRFVYAPDLVRNADGTWLVLEDNIGCVGGVADGLVVLNQYTSSLNFKLSHELGEYTGLREGITSFLERVELGRPRDRVFGIPGTVTKLGDTSVDEQTAWKSQILETLELQVTQPEKLLREIRSGLAQPAGIVNLSTTQGPAILELANAAFSNRTTPHFGAPYTGVVSSKFFHALGDNLVQSYLGEDAILKTPTTQVVREMNALNRRGVLKRTNGCGGTEIFSLDGRRVSKSLIERVKSWGPSGAVIQDEVSCSTIEHVTSGIPDTAQVEIRLIAYVTGWGNATIDQVVSAKAIKQAALKGQQREEHSVRNLPVIREPAV